MIPKQHIESRLQLLKGIFWPTMASLILSIFLPWMIGGYLIALISWPIYKAMCKAAQEITGQKT